MTIRRPLLIAAAVSVAAVLGIGAMTFGAPSVPVVAPQANVAIQVYGLGTVEARILSKIGFQVSGAINELHADVGDRVAAGTVLARLDASEQRAKQAQAEAAVLQAQAGIEQAKAGIVKAEAMRVKKAGVSRRRNSLVKDGWTSPEVAEDARTDTTAAGADLAVARSAVAVAQANLTAAQAALERERAVLEKYTLSAPYDSIVIQRHKEAGSVLANGEPVFTVIDDSSIWVLAYVEEARSGGLALGQPAELRLRSRPGETFPGHVARIDVESDRVSEERKVYVAFDAPPANLHLGEQAEAIVTVATLNSATMVPPTAVADYKQGRGTVWAIEGGRLKPYPVRLGAAGLDGKRPVLDPLPTDAAIVGSLPAHPRSGDRVRGETP